MNTKVIARMSFGHQNYYKDVFGHQKLLQGRVLDAKFIARTCFGHQKLLKGQVLNTEIIARMCFGHQKLLQGRVLDTNKLLQRRVLDIRIIAWTSMLSYESPDILYACIVVMCIINKEK